MHAFDFVIVFLSFVYAAAIVHILATTGDIAMAAKRIRLSWLNAGWMLVGLLSTCSWWISMWDMRTVKVWNMPTLGFMFVMAAGFYLLTRLVSPRIPHDGEVDLQAFHRDEGRKYMAWFALLAAITVGANVQMGQAFGIGEFLTQNMTVAPMALAATAAAIFIRRPRVQAACLIVELAAWACYFGFQQRSLMD